MDGIVILIWITICCTAITIGLVTMSIIAMYVKGYTTKEIAKEVSSFIAPSEEELY